jgi:hypothetical protein
MRAIVAAAAGEFNYHRGKLFPRLEQIDTFG